jgi:hypothetical protein
MKFKSAFVAILLLSFLTFSFYIQTYNTAVEIKFGNYLISTHSTLLALSFLTSNILLMIVLRIIVLPFRIFKKLADSSRRNKEKSLFKNSIKAGQYILIGDSKKAQKIMQSILDGNARAPIEIDNYLRLLFLKTNLSFNIKLHYLQKLLNDSGNEYRFFIARDLSRLALENKLYHYSLEFALIAFEINKTDLSLLELLIEVYATLESWNKMGEMAHLISSLDAERFGSIKQTISTYYLKAAKHFIGLGQASDSSFYLKKCLELKPDSYKCIELIAGISKEIKDVDLKKIIEKAFAINPSFKLFQIYYQHHKDHLMAQEMYNNLIGAIDKEKHLDLAISVAYFLNIQQELNKIVLPLI